MTSTRVVHSWEASGVALGVTDDYVLVVEFTDEIGGRYWKRAAADYSSPALLAAMAVELVSLARLVERQREQLGAGGMDSSKECLL